MNILWAVFWFLLLGGGFGLLLAFAGKIFAVKIDPRVEAIKEILPGVNCGGCGQTNCEKFAEAVVKGEAKHGDCPVDGEEVVLKIAEIMGQNADKFIRYRAQVMCTGMDNFAHNKYDYLGVPDCIQASRLANGTKACPNGCLGFGTCADYCKFNAIKMINGIATVDYNKCKACGVCVWACPKQIIKLIPFDSTHWVGCVSNDKGAVTRKNCDIGCIGCKLCEKSCKQEAVKIDDFVASIDYDKCIGCGECVIACPRNIIWSKALQEEFISGNLDKKA